MDQSIRQTARPDLASPYQAGLVRHHRRLTVVGLMLWDQILILIGFAVAYWLRYVANWPNPLRTIVAEVATQNQVEFSAFLPILVPLMFLLAVRFAARGLYRSTPHLSLIEQIGIIVNSTHRTPDYLRLSLQALLLLTTHLCFCRHPDRAAPQQLASADYRGTPLAVVTWYWPRRYPRRGWYWSWPAGDE